MAIPYPSERARWSVGMRSIGNLHGSRSNQVAPAITGVPWVYGKNRKVEPDQTQMRSPKAIFRSHNMSHWIGSVRNCRGNGRHCEPSRRMQAVPYACPYLTWR